MSAKEAQKEREREREFQEKQEVMRNAFNASGDMKRDFINELLKQDELKTGGAGDLQEVTVAKVQNMLSRDWVLANMTSAQEHDIRFKLEVMKYKVLGMHPPEESAITGPVRAFIFDDPMEELKPLTQQERLLIDDLFETLKARLTRGREGFERRQMNTNIAETHTRNDSEDKKAGGLKGLFNR